MGIKFYDSNGKYWGEYDETRNLFIPFKKRTMRDCYNCKRYETEGECIECRYEPKGEPQTDYNKSLELFAEVLFDKEKSEQFLKECKAMGIEPQTDWNETLPCHKCESALSSECTACDGQQYFRTEEGETDCPWK